MRSQRTVPCICDVLVPKGGCSITVTHHIRCLIQNYVSMPLKRFCITNTSPQKEYSNICMKRMSCSLW